jgi:hypothetical protein
LGSILKGGGLISEGGGLTIESGGCGCVFGLLGKRWIRGRGVSRDEGRRRRRMRRIV